MIVTFFTRLALAAAVVITAPTMLVAELTRSGQPPLPPLLYANGTLLHLAQTNCDGLWAVCAERDRVLLDNLSFSFPVAQWSPDGDYIAVDTDNAWDIYRADCLLDGQSCPPTPLDSAVTDIRVAWGHNSDAVAYMVDAATGTLRIRPRACWVGSLPEQCAPRTILLSNYPLVQPDWSADGSRMVFIGPAQGVYAADLLCQAADCADPREVLLAFANQQYQGWPSLSADGSAVLVSEIANIPGVNEQLFILDLPTGERHQLTFRNADSFMPDWSADDRYVAYAGFARPGDGNMDIYVLDLPRGLHVRLVRNPGRDMFPNWGPAPK